MSGGEPNRVVIRFLLAFAALVVIVAGLRAASPLLAPCALGVLVAIALMPLVARLRAAGMPRSLAIATTACFSLILLLLAASLLTDALLDLRSVLPEIVGYVRHAQEALGDALAGSGLPAPPLFIGESWAQGPEMVSLALKSLAGVVKVSFVVILFALFVLSDMANWQDRFVAAFGADANILRWTGIAGRVRRYLILKSAISLATGALVGTWCAILGVQGAPLWGITAFFLNYIPNIGSVIAALPPIALGLLVGGPGTALALAAGYVLVNTALGVILEPLILGRDAGLSALVVVFGLLFWGWVWGPIGMLISLPLTLVVRAALETRPETLWLSTLMGPRGAAGECVDARDPA